MLLDSKIFTLLKRELEHDIQKSLSVFCCALIVVFILQWIVKNIVEISKLPPGPLGIFPFGILKLIGHEKHKSFMKLATTYGPLFSCKLGMQLYVVISDYKLIREIFKKESLTGRPKTPLYNGKNTFLIFFFSNFNFNFLFFLFFLKLILSVQYLMELVSVIFKIIFKNKNHK